MSKRAEDPRRPPNRFASTLALVRRGPEIVRNNPEILQAARELAIPETRLEGVLTVLRLAVTKLLGATIESRRGAAKGAAAQLFSQPGVGQALADISHFGALADIVQIRATRLDYVELLLHEILELKERAPQLALGSKVTSGPGEIRNLSRLEFAQIVLLASNLGHLFGTFATERALLAMLASDARLQSRWMDSIQPPQARDTARRIAQGHELHRFHYAIALWRLPRLVTPKLAQIAQACLCAYLDGALEKDPQIAWVISVARKIAYSRVHALTQIGSPIGPMAGPEIYDEILGRAEMQFHDGFGETSTFLGLLEASEDHVHRVFFASPKAASVVLDHNLRFRRWWCEEQARGRTETESISRLFTRPDDWPHDAPAPLEHALRLELAADPSEWFREVERWRAEPSVWGKWRFLISPIGSRERGYLLCDVYRTDEAGVDWRVVRRIAERLADHVRSTWTSQNATGKRTTWVSAAAFGCFVLRQGFEANVTIRLQAIEAESDSMGVCLMAGSTKELLDRLGRFTSRCTSAARRAELDAVHRHLAAQPPRDGTQLLFLARVLLKDGDRAEIGELDGVHASFDDSGVDWTFIETKDTKAGNGVSQLASTLQRAFGRSPLLNPLAPGAGRGCYATIRFP